MACRVLVSTLAGDSLDVDLQPQSTILQLKEAVAGSSWGIPLACQRFVGADALEALDDSELVLHAHYKLIISLEAVRLDLECGDALRRRAALQDLGRLGLKGGEAALAAIIACCEDTAFEVRWAAVLAIAHVVQKGDQRAISAVVTRLEDHAPCVREAAVRASAQIVEPGDQQAIAAIAQRLEHHDHEVREAAVEAVAQTSERGDQHCLTRLTALLDRDDHNVVMAAVEAIAKVADRGNQQAIDAINGYLEKATAGGTKGTNRLVRFKAKRLVAELSREWP